MIPVTKPYFPLKSEVYRLLDNVWKDEWLTNNGPLLKELEKRLGHYLSATTPAIVTNGTIALQLAIRALNLEGEIITTPFSYVATASSIVWEHAKPVFVDIDEHSFNLDPRNIKESITDRTSAILATHVFGNPCAVKEIQEIADRNDLKVIYDAAHAFGTRLAGQSIFSYGDVSTASFHATKIFHMVEGGAVFTSDESLLERVRYMRNFGHDGPEHFNGVGVNGKNSEFHAAMGLAVLKQMNEIMKVRKEQWEHYQRCLNELSLQFQKIDENVQYNYSYFPIVLPDEKMALELKSMLEKNNIYPRRYFYPSLDTLDYISDQYKLPKAHSISSRILCLPLYHNLAKKDQNRVCDLIIQSIDQ